MYMKRYLWLWAVLLSIALGSSCTERLEDDLRGGESIPLVRATFAKMGADEAGRLPERIGNVEACLFEGGVMTETYDGLEETGGGYVLRLERLSGTLYMLANAEGLVNLKQMQEEGITESEWRETVVASRDGRAVSFFSGKLDLDASSGGRTELPLTLERGVVRFDLLVRGSEVAVGGVTFRNVMQEGYLLSRGEPESPAESERGDLAVSFTEALSGDSLGIAYVYEQLNPDLEVRVEAVIGGRSYTLEGRLPERLKRNTVYTLTVRRDETTEAVSLQVEEWADGGESALTPDLDGRLTVDRTDSRLPDGARLNEAGDELSLSCAAADFTLAVSCAEELEFVPDAGLPVSVEPVPDAGRGKNLFRVSKKLLPPGYPAEKVTLRFRRKGLQGTYDDDRLTLVLRENPIRVEGGLTFGKEDYTCDFARYIDNELGRFVMPEGMELEVRFEDGEDPWVKVERVEGSEETYRVLGGWKPNDPKADGRAQAAKLVARRASDGVETEVYTVKRRNYGMPVTLMNGIWWCKYNAVGDLRSFDDQILVPQDPAANAGKTVFEYLSDCTPEEYMRLYDRSSYIGDGGVGMAVFNDGGTLKLKGYVNPPVSMSHVDPKALSPDGYEMPAVADYDRVFDGSWYMRFDVSGGPYAVHSPWEGNREVFVLSGSRSDLVADGLQLPVIYHAEVYDKIGGVKKESVTFYGPGAQWGGGGVNHNKIVFAAYSKENAGWFHAFGGWGLRRQTNGKENSRVVRLIKSPVEYMYGL